MRSDTHLDNSPSPCRARRFAWPALVVALTFGAVEWFALARSRGADRFGEAWRRLRHR